MPIPNGGFEDGDFGYWTAVSGVRQGFLGFRWLALNTQGIAVNRHVIVSAAGNDPLIGAEIPLTFSGAFAARLGNDIKGSQAERLAYSFKVTEDLRMFSFAYAIVLQDPKHPKRDQPYFQYRIFRGGTSTFWTNIVDKEIVAETSPYFKKKGDEIYRQWTVVCVDLSNHVGKAVTIDFTTADCFPGDHFCYAYIDGLGENLEAVPQLELPSSFCAGAASVIADGSGSRYESDHFWSIEESDASGGRNPATEVGGWLLGKQAGSINLVTLYGALGGKFECNRYYRVKLAVKNACTPWAEVVKVVKAGCPEVDAGSDRYFCCGQYDNVKLGVTAVPGWTYSWSPVAHLSNASVAQPILLVGQLFAGITQFPHSDVYTVTAVDPSGCVGTDQVTLTVNCAPSISITAELVDVCAPLVRLTANANGGGPYSYQWSTGAKSPTIDVAAKTQRSYELRVRNNCGEAKASITVDELQPLSGPFPALLFPNVITPNADGINDRLMFTDLTKPLGYSPSYNATDYRVHIYNRWGALVALLQGGSQAGFANQSIPGWDGVATHSVSYTWLQKLLGRKNSLAGQKVTEGTYFYQAYLANCAQSLTEVGKGSVFVIY